MSKKINVAGYMCLLTDMHQNGLKLRFPDRKYEVNHLLFSSVTVYNYCHVWAGREREYCA